MADVEENSRMKIFRDFMSNFFKKQLLTILMLLGALLGTILGISLHEVDMNPNTKQYIGFMGDILHQALKSVSVPVTVAALISTIGVLRVKDCRNVSLRLFMYLLISKSFAAVLSILLCLIMRPGETKSGLGENLNITIFSKTASRRAEDKFLDIGRNLLPENWVEMFIAHYETQLINATGPDSVDFSVKTSSGTNWLGMIVVSILIGMALSRMGEERTPLTTVFSCVTDVCMIVSRWVAWFAPIGILFIICRDILKVETTLHTLEILGRYVAILLSCCIVQLVIVHPLIYFTFTHKNPYKVFISFPESFIISLVTGSSSGTIPIAMKELKENLNVDERVVNIVVPIGITINKDGNFYMYVIGCIFEADRTERHMGIDLIVLIIILALTTSISSAAIQNQGFVLLIMMWSTLNFKHVDNDIVMLVVVDYITDRFRTLLHVFSNIYCAVVLDYLNMFDDAETDD